MLSFNKVSRELGAAYQRTAFAAGPVSDIAPQFYPLLDRQVGLASTRLCMELGARLAVAPEKVWHELGRVLNPELAQLLCFREGFLNLVPRPQVWEWLEFETDPPRAQQPAWEVLLPCPYDELCGLSHLRLVCSALLQLSALRGLGYACSLTLGDGTALLPYTTELSHTALRKVLCTTLELRPLSRGAALEQLLEFACNTQAHNVSVWCYLPHLGANCIEGVSSEPEAGQRSNCFASGAHAWVFGFEQNIQGLKIEESDLSYLLSVIMLLAGPLAAADFEFELCALQSAINPVWLLRASGERLRRLIGVPLRDAAPRDQHVNHAALENWLIEPFWRAAAKQAMVGDYLTFLDRRLRCFNRDLNLERYDFKLTHGSHRPAGEAALALAAALASLIQRDPILSQYCMDVVHE